MKFDVLYNFISPVTGRVLSDPDYVLLGNEEGVAIPSPILIDMRLDLIDMRQDVDNLSMTNFIVGYPNSQLPNAQALNALDNGFMYNTDGIVSTTSNIPLPNLTENNIWIGDKNNRPVETSTILQSNLPNLTQKKIWVGDTDNRPQPTQVIDISNLPNLGVTDVPNPFSGGFVGKIWEGTALGRPEESSIVGEMFADIAILNAKFLAGKFLMKSGLTASFPAAQFLDSLTANKLLQTSSLGDGSLATFDLQLDQVLMGGADGAESRARIGVENLPLLAQNKIWVGDINSIPQSAQTIDISNLPTLTSGKVWQGDATNRPVETEFNFAPNDATYILQTANENLNQAQVLSELGSGMAKIVAGGSFAIAIADEDYATKSTLEQIKAETEAFKDEAAASAEEAAASATEAAASATEASASALEATGAAGTATAAAAEASGAAATATGAAGTAGVSALAAAASALSAGSSSSSASSSASDASSSATNAHTSETNAQGSATQAQTYLTTLLNTGITLQGDITGSGNLSNPIITIFKENPTFLGHEYIKIPTGNTAQRPSNPSVGMIRCNTDI